MRSKPRNIVVTYALPYANGSIHIGHMLGMIQTDVWVRFQGMRGHQVHFFNGDDAHGTPIMLSAEKAGISPEDLINKYHEEHARDLKDFGIEFNNFYSTHSPENEKLSSEIYLKLDANGHIAKRTIKQAFDPEKNMFLPDRYVKGECPRCGAADQYGDNCEACGATYSPTDLKNPVSALSGVPPIEKESEHYFFKLGDFTKMLKEWTHAGHLQTEVANKLKEWFEAGLNDWDISRDAPYFGIKIPNTEDKYFYVWMDAPIGYLSSMLNYAEQNKDFDFDAVIAKNSDVELYHFVGKDIIYFHALFWPAVLAGSEHRTPDAVYAHGFVTVNGQKMSKSRGTFINARTYLDHLNPEYLRYYFCARLGHSLDDIDFSQEDFTLRVNSDLVGKYVNIASRSANFIAKNFDGQLCAPENPELIAKLSKEAENIAKLYENREYSKAMREIMALADLANQYIADAEPWKKIKQDDLRESVQGICSTAINAFRILTIYLKPVLPNLAKQAEAFLNLPEQQWADAQQVLQDHRINAYQALLQRIDPKEVQNMIDANQQPTVEATPELSNPLADEITIDDFVKVDLRVAKIIEADHVEGADKLIRLKLDLGDGVHKQVFAGIKSAYKPEDLLGKLTIMVANLKPRKMRFGMSEGMVLAASGDGPGIYILEPHAGAQPGMRVK
jgi:methionyl-tRNA synthetase